MKNFYLFMLLLFVSLFGSYCFAGLEIGPIRGPISFDQFGEPGQIESNPAWSPDGTRAAWRFGVPGGILVTIGRGPDNPLKQYAGWDCDYPDWSPDGEWIVYAKSRVGESYLERVSVETGEQVSIPTPVEFVKDPHWSPCGDSIAYIGGSWRPEADRIYITDPSGLVHDTKTGDRGIINDLSWCPNCDYIVFTQAGETDLFILDILTEVITPYPVGSLPAGVIWATENSILFDAAGGIYDYQIDSRAVTQLTFAQDHLGDYQSVSGIIFSRDLGNGDWDIYTAVPEPATLLLLGLGGLEVIRKR